MNRAALGALLSHWRRRPLQLVALVLGLMLATALWSGVQAINAEARRAYDRAASLLGGTELARLARPDNAPVPLADYVALRRAGYLVSPVIEAELDGMTLLGLDPLTAPPGVLPADLVEGAVDFEGFAGDGTLFVSPETAEQGLSAPLPTAISRDLPPGTILADIGRVAALSGQQDPSYLLVAPVQPPGLPPLSGATALELRAPDAATDLGELTGAFHLNLTAFGLLSFGVGLFIAHGAIGLAVEQRRPVIRTLRAIGLPLRRLILLLAVELLAIALAAGLAGVAIGYAIAAALLPGVAGTLRGLYGAPVGGELGFDPAWAALAVLIALAGAAVAGAGALIRVARMPVLAPALPRAWAMNHSTLLRRQGLAAIALFALAGILTTGAQSLVIAFAALAALLFGAALALPLVLTAALRAAAPLARGAYGEWVLADTRQQVPGLSLALMALLLALSANIGVSTMVGSFRDTFTGWLDRRLVAEVYVRADGDPAALATRIAPLADAVLPVSSVDRPLLGAPGSVMGQADDPAYRETWPLLSAEPGAWDSLHAGEALFVNEQLALGADLSLGDTVEIAPGTALPVAAIYADYGNPEGQALLGADRFARVFPEAEPFGFALRTGDTPALLDALRAIGLPDDAVTDRDSQKRLSLRIFDQTFRVTGALSALTLAVAGVALLIGSATLAGMRLPQVAPLWALGQTRARLARTEFARALALAALTFAAALPTGLAFAWLLLNRINTEAFGWRLPMILFPRDWLTLGLLAALAAGLAGLGPALRLARIPPARLLQVFSNER
ncbi:FtsX-like permease family protein [Rhodobacterales bacterium HKCCE2091]|nr:FtsX-like permease family protein [Rhodobacterales bacterium HKCCE2091]